MQGNFELVGSEEVLRSFRILVVDDFERFRRFVCSVLRQRTEFQVIAEVSDGLEAVATAKESCSSAKSLPLMWSEKRLA